MKKLLIPLALITCIATSAQAHPKKHKPLFMRHKHKKKRSVTKKTVAYRDADIVSVEPL
jgi:hypothetical protein